MTKTAFYARHKALPGKRDALRQVWEKYARAYIADADVQLAYFYCYDDGDPDTIIAFQLCTDPAGVADFTKQAWFQDYQAETAALIAGPSEFRTMTPMWIKGDTA
jgi:quinol monooxygenase YgiN